MNKTKLSIASAGVGLVVLGGATVFAMGQGTEPNQASNHLQAPETVVETVTRVETVTEEVPVVVTETLTQDVRPPEGRSDLVGNPPVPPPTTQPEAPEIPPTTTTPPTTTKPPVTSEPTTTPNLPPTTTTQPPTTTTQPPTTTTPPQTASRAEDR